MNGLFTSLSAVMALFILVTPTTSFGESPDTIQAVVPNTQGGDFQLSWSTTKPTRQKVMP